MDERKTIVHKCIDYFENLGAESRGLSQYDGVRAIWWRMLKEHGSMVPLPTVGLTNERTIRLAWNSAGKFLDIELYPDGKCEWFYADDELWITEGSEEREDRIPDGFFEKAHLFVTAHISQ